MLNTLNHSVCDKTLTIDHAITSQHGSLTSVDLRDITAELLSTVCNNVTIHPPLQPLSGEFLTPGSANRQDDARVYIQAHGFYGQRQSSFLIYGFIIQTHKASAMHKWNLSYRHHKIQNKREYGDQVSCVFA